MNNKTEQTMTDVVPCPFCGSTEGFYVEEGSTSHWRVLSCRNCGEGTEVRHKNNSDEPDSYIADWNAAAPYPAMLRKELENLREQLAEAERELIVKEAQLAETQGGAERTGETRSVGQILDAADAALASAAQPAAVPPEGFVVLPVELVKRVQESLGEFLMDHGWSQRDMDTSDEFGTVLLAAAPKAAKGEQ